MKYLSVPSIVLLFIASAATANSQHVQTARDEKAEAVLNRAVAAVGGDKYLKVTSQVGRGKYSIIRDNALVSFQTFLDVIVYPDTERTEFKSNGVKTIQTNSGASGWLFDGDQEVIREQSPEQVENFRRGLRTSIDYLLRGHWRGSANMSYVGKRPSTLGKRNDVVKLVYNDGFTVEFEFSDDGLPAKAIHKRMNADNTEVTEEDRYAQFIEINGIKTPFIIDRFTNGSQSSRTNYEAVEFNRSVPSSIFTKPANPKELKKDLKL